MASTRAADACRRYGKKKALADLLREVPPVDDSSEPLDPEQAVAGLLRRFSSIPGGIEAPNQLFTLLVDQLDIEKGALLLPDYDGTHLAPWVVCNIDTTSEHRLRIPISMVSGQCETASVGIVEGAALEQWKPYFSFREGSMLRRLAVVPFCTGNEVAAVILILDSPYLSTETLAIKLIVSAIREPAEALLGRHHEARRRAGFRAVLTGTADVLRHIEDQRHAADHRPVVCASVTITDLVDAICTAYPGADRFRAIQDVLRIIGSMLDGTAVAGLLDDGRVVITMNPDASVAADLVLHQLALGLTRIFHEMDPQIDLSPRTMKIQPDGPPVSEVLDVV